MVGWMFSQMEVAYLKIAAWSVIQAHPSGHVSDSQVLIAGQVPGILQSAFRAELFAVLQALKYTWYWNRKIRIWSDCQSVVSRLLQMLYTHKAPAANSIHADLWPDIYELLECLQFQESVIVTKVAAHQDVDEVCNAAEQWAFVHNALADRTARLANLQRTNVFWALHREHARAVEFASFVSTVVQDVIILNISRKVVLHESTCGEIPVEELQPQHVAPLMSVQAPRWEGFTPKFPLPLNCTAKYGHRFVATVTSRFQQAIFEAKHADSAWISVHQLFLDYQFQTGELGPIRDRTWIDTAQQSCFRLKPHPFKKRDLLGLEKRFYGRTIVFLRLLSRGLIPKCWHFMFRRWQLCGPDGGF